MVGAEPLVRLPGLQAGRCTQRGSLVRPLPGETPVLRTLPAYLAPDERGLGFAQVADAVRQRPAG